MTGLAGGSRVVHAGNARQIRRRQRSNGVFLAVVASVAFASGGAWIHRCGLSSRLEARRPSIMARKAMSFGAPKVNKEDLEENETMAEAVVKAKLVELEGAEEQNEEMARKMAAVDDVADAVANEIVSASARDEDTQIKPTKDDEKDDEAVYEEIAVPKNSKVIASAERLTDYSSLIRKYGGFKSLMQDHVKTSEEGLFDPERLDDTRQFFGEINAQEVKAETWFVDFEYEGGGTLRLLGTSHMCTASNEFVRKTVKSVKPECLVIERRLGDDSLQRLAIPEQTVHEIAFANPPNELMDTDGPYERVAKFHQDRAWLGGFPGWKDIGSEAAMSQEFGIAVEEFVKLREQGQIGGPRGGTVCLGDADLRMIAGESSDESYMPALSDFSKDGPNVPLRDLLLAQSMRAAMRTHKSSVAVVGLFHVAGVMHLFNQDPKIKVTKNGTDFGVPMWLKDLEEGGKKWERAASARNSIFSRMTRVMTKRPYGTFLAADAVAELINQREVQAKVLREKGLDGDPLVPSSSVLAARFFESGAAISPENLDELKDWLAGKETEPQFAGEFPFENQDQRKLHAAKMPEREKEERMRLGSN